tara:strand:- start:5019 stop:5237 length:219 start_codon:yes stop_codon:yes gene_type:complete
MSSRIAKVYDGYLAYEKSMSKQEKPKNKKVPSSLGLGGRVKPASMKKDSSNKLSELNKVAEMIQTIREYRTS